MRKHPAKIANTLTQAPTTVDRQDNTHTATMTDQPVVTQKMSRWIPPHLLAIISMISVQFGAAFSKRLFPLIGTTATTFIRLAMAAVVLMIVTRPRWQKIRRQDYILVALFGLAIGCMTALYYAAIARLPLGVAVTLEFLGPLGVAVAMSRRLMDIVWAGCALVGVILLTPLQGATFDLLGIIFALGAAVCWAAYILLNARVGRVFADASGLALAMSVGALVLLPLSVPTLGLVWQQPMILALGVIVAIFSSLIPFSLEMMALRNLSPRVFGILLSLEPVIAMLIGLAFLGETISTRALAAMVLIVIASIGASLGAKRH